MLTIFVLLEDRLGGGRVVAGIDATCKIEKDEVKIKVLI